MACEHQAVTVWYSTAVRQRYDRTMPGWYGVPTVEQIRGIDHIECLECGEDLTSELHQEISEAS